MEYISRIVDDVIDRKTEAFKCSEHHRTKRMWKDKNSKRTM